jgi:uracil-DNA glycosylase family 4
MLKGIRNPQCTECKLHASADVVCQIGMGPPTADIMVVTRMANSSDWQMDLQVELEDVGLDSSKVYFSQALKCRTFDQDASNADVKACRHYLDAEIAAIKPKWILAMGNEALLSTLGKSGITKYRGRTYTRPDGVEVIPTISPSAVKRNPGQKPGYYADLRLFVNKIKGRSSGIKPPKYEVIDTKDKIKLLKKVLASTIEIDLDVETHGEYFKVDGRLISLSGTCVVKTALGLEKVWVFALPLYHPESPWKSMHRSVMLAIKGELEKIPKHVAHNASYDYKWLRQYGINVLPTFDPMLAIHLLNENVQKGLKPQAMARLGVEPWGIDTKSLLHTPLKDVLHYNVLDTWYMYHIRKQIVQELEEQPPLARLHKRLMTPAQGELIQSEMRGIWINTDRLRDRTPLVAAELVRIHEAIMVAADLQCDSNPLGLKPDDDAWPKDAKGKPREVNFNASIFARWLLFDWCGLPVHARGKNKSDGSPGDPSMAEDVLMALEDAHPVVKLMLERVEWQKYMSSFLNPYSELYDDEHRIHTNFKLAGTVTGRLSSGKDDADKVSGVRGKLRGVNLQQVPRKPLIRGLFGAFPGWTFVEADYSQIELRIAAFLARERHMLHLYSIGADIHLTTAARVTGLPESQVTKEIRKKVGKPVNFGFLYGMGWAKFIATAFSSYGSVFTEEEAKAARKAYFDLFPDLTPWHNKQRRLVHANGRVQSPIGRIRHLPDIYSPEQGVRAEAERQAINSPVQGFGSDLAVLSMVHINRKLRKEGIAGHCLGLVHDAINYEIRDDHVAEALPIIKSTMEDMSILRREFGVHIDVPIIADLQVGRHWGDTQELSEDQVYNYLPEYAGA